ncbi:MAG: bifunctional D-glycero-beta-D-manno-heptose-7-phosphate kinase/D-glycero-beta-D-manno-heptose 1-phosphate adenylyltransferase HldE [Methylococcales bacterium]|jgi:D-beta-D-heptose 7-phosphate kinase/D-beta-D-heptose 1-phosphate adenosyltransferase|nr:bifunctional D-glycero-beta-D-manno-heptose-7-phosphate kinase/D-glycero-beta-D-manno-heptose 1-phosphate adenylyltransferase HldE [Methylococcales bacterium]
MQFPGFTSAKVLVVGDLMLDQYWHGSTSRVSPEAPVPIVHVNDREFRPGGAGNVALNLAALGVDVTLVGYCGQDESAETLTTMLTNAGVTCCFITLDEYPTITKLRVMSRNQQLIRLDFEEDFQQFSSDQLLTVCPELIEQADAVIFSDYGKGTLAQVEQLIALAKRYNKPALVDPKGADFERYRKSTIMTPNLSEFEAVVGPCPDQDVLVEKGYQLMAELGMSGLLITRSEHGMTLLEHGCEPLHLPTQARDVFDVTGAGDTVISVLAASLAANESFANATWLANTAAGIVVGKSGTAVVSTAEMVQALEGRQLTHGGVVLVAELESAMDQAHKNNEIIVATNGCFDILHPGHVRYLQQARELGDRLVVLVNSDESVRRLKGSTRPVNSLAQRMEMLAALTCVDWVVAFSEDTPQAIIDRLLPDVLVKGGDYQDITEIAGHESVLANGGDVKILSFNEGHSTTNIINAIKDGEKSIAG